MEQKVEYITAKDAWFEYESGGFMLSPISISLHTGEVTFLVGENGGGKSTFAKLMCGILKPSGGTVLLSGTDTKKMSLGEVGSRVGYLWQNTQLQLFAQMVIEDMTFIDKISGGDMEKARGKAREWLSFFNLADKEDSMIYTLSGGERQRLALAVSLMNGAKYFILDEPTKGLDEHNREVVIQFLEKTCDKNDVGMLIISHDEDFCQRFAGRVITVEKGEVTDDTRRRKGN